MKIQNVFVGMIIAQAIMVNAAGGSAGKASKDDDKQKCTSGMSHSFVSQLPAGELQSTKRCKGLAPAYPLVAAQKQSLLDERKADEPTIIGEYFEEFQVGDPKKMYQGPVAHFGFYDQAGYLFQQRMTAVLLGNQNLIMPLEIARALGVSHGDARGAGIIPLNQSNNIEGSFTIGSIADIPQERIYTVFHPWMQSQGYASQTDLQRHRGVEFSVEMGIFHSDGVRAATTELDPSWAKELMPMSLGSIEKRQVAFHGSSYSPANAEFSMDPRREVATGWAVARYERHSVVNFFVLLKTERAQLVFEGPLKVSNTIKDVINVLNERAAQFQNPADKEALRRAAFILCTAATAR